MKKLISVAAVAALTIEVLFAGGVENKTNLSNGYIRNPSRNTETKRADAAFYNIAGTAFMDDGFYFGIGNQFVVKKYTHTYLKNNYSDHTTVFLYPDANIVYKRGNFSAFANFGVYAGGGKLNYNRGSIALGKQFLDNANKMPAGSPASKILTFAGIDHTLKVTSIAYGSTIGAGYAFGDKISLAGGFRAVYGTQAMEINSTWFQFMGNFQKKVSCESDAWGFSGMFGVHLKPIDALDVSVQYQHLTPLRYKVKDVDGRLASQFNISKGKKYHSDLPSVFTAGVGYQALDPLYISFSFEYYMNQFYAHQDSILGTTKYNNSWEIGMGADYKISDLITVSGGVDYARQGTNSSSNNIFNPVLNSFLVGGGLEITPTDALTFSAGAMYVKYFEKRYESLKLNKNVVMISVGATYKLDFNK